jgi:tetratricopeptide (TPR) repeat protein
LWPEIARARDGAPPPSSAPAQDGAMLAAKKHFEAGRAAYDVGNYARAVEEFKAAEALKPAPTLSYNIGLANEKLLRPRAAIRYYRHYLEALPKAPNHVEVEQSIARLEKQLSAQPATTPPEEATTAVVDPSGPPPPAMAADPNAPPPHASYDPYARAPVPIAPPAKRRNLWWVWLLVGIGGALVITAIVVVAVVAARDQNQNVYDAAHIDGNRLPTTDRAIVDLKDRFDRASGGSQAAQVAPLFQVHF